MEYLKFLPAAGCFLVTILCIFEGVRADREADPDDFPGVLMALPAILFLIIGLFCLIVALLL